MFSHSLESRLAVDLTNSLKDQPDISKGARCCLWGTAFVMASSTKKKKEKKKRKKKGDGNSGLSILKDQHYIID